MQPVIIRVDEQRHVKLYADDGQPHWDERCLVDETLPADFTVVHEHTGKCDPSVLVAAEDVVAAGPVLRRAGEYLFHLLNQGTVGVEWTRMLAEARPLAGGEPNLRTFLDIRHPAVAAWPWELMGCGMRRLFLEDAVAIVRVRPDALCACDQARWPIRVLVIVGSASADAIGWEDEVESLQDEFHAARQLVDVEVVLQPDRTKLTGLLATYDADVLHFIGHGRVDAAQGSVLDVWSSSLQGYWAWPATEVKLNLEPRPPRLAFLNACRTGDPSARAAARALADACLQAHVGAVVSMRDDVAGAAAATLATVFYRELAAGRPVDRAMVCARRAVMNRNDVGVDRRQWTSAVLEVGTQPDRPPLQFAVPDPQTHAHLIQIPEFADICDFVDRVAERRQVFGTIDRATVPAAASAEHSVLIVRGEGEVGKTSVVFWCLEGCARRGYTFTHVDFAGSHVGNWLDVLRKICGGTPGTGLCAPLDACVCTNFNWVLNQVLAGRDPSLSAPPPGVTADLGLALPQDGHEHMIPKIFDAFLEVLRNAASVRPLVIALDHLGRRGSGICRDDFQNLLLPRLVEPILRGSVPKVRLVLVVNEAEFEEFGLRKIQSRALVVPIRAFSPSLLRPLARLYLRRHRLDPAVFGPIVEAFANAQKTDWKPRNLRKLKEAVDTLG